MSEPERRRRIAERGDLSAQDLQAIAEMPIMDPGRLYLPAGKLSEAEYQAREQRIRNGEPI
jgi:hypothetical protein